MHIHNADCLSVLKTMADGSIDSIVTDPPTESGFWTRLGQVPSGP